MKLLNSENVTHIAVHHSATSANTTVESIRRYHIDRKGWSDIGYHFLIDTHGVIHKGRDTKYIGAHVKHANPYSIGICMIGDYSSQKPSRELTKALVGLVKDLQIKYNKVTNENVKPHRQFPQARTTCYGSALSDDWIQEELERVDSGIKKYSSMELITELMDRLK